MGQIEAGQNTAEKAEQKVSEYLCSDLDGTLIKGDLFFEGLLKLIKKNPLLIIPLLISWARGGRIAAKYFLVEQIEIDPENLPVHNHYLDYLINQHKEGRKLVLVTASPEPWAQAIADKFGIFSRVIASTAGVNCKAEQKVQLLKATLGSGSFEYAGNDYPDVPVWKVAAERVVVSANKKLIDAAKSIGEIKYLFDQDIKPKFSSLLKAMRPHQWAKNLLLFVPMFMAHSFLSVEIWVQVVIAFCSFSAAATGVYLLNDLMDLDADRQHLTKKFRPIANGDVSILTALVASACSFLLGIALACLLPTAFLKTILLYLFVTTLYSFYLKQLPIVDILLLAFLYSLRVFAGGTATGIPVSTWLIAFSVFFFVSLASLKRYIELLNTEAKSDKPIAGRGYCASDMPIVLQAGMSTAAVAVLVLALYINNPEVAKLYKSPTLLWIFCPMMLYWLLRIWMLANRKLVNEDPVLFAIKDRVTYFLAFVGLAVILVAGRF